MTAERAPATPHLFNSLSRRVEPIPLEHPVGLYVCGITPYDATHLGHAFTYTSFDVLIRFLRFLGHEVVYVQNITDIDDDILKRAASVGTDWRSLGDSEVQKFLRDSDAINNLRPDHMPRATEHIEGMHEMIIELLARGVAYEREGNVYFEVAKAPTFGTRLFGLDSAEQLRTANERGNFPDDPLKKDPLDFVLWQRSKPGEPHWSSPWGEGRPGWHIECSALSYHFLGPRFALHGGGADLLFPHHECEIAQAEYCRGEVPAACWAHTGMLRYDGEKMSKSLGNMVFVTDLLEQYSGNAIRLALLRHHYRESWEYEDAHISETQQEALALEHRLRGVAGNEGAGPDASLASPLLDALADDLDTPRALEALQALAARDEPEALATARTLATEVLGLRL